MHLVIADEGRGPFAEDANTIKGRSPLSDLQGTGRSAEVSFYVLTNALTLTDRGLRSNVFLTAAFRPANGEDARLLQRTLGLSDAQTAYLERMPRGEVVVKLGGNPAFLATFDPLPDTFDPTTYQQARERTRTILLAKRQTATAKEENDGQPAPPSPATAYARATPLRNPTIALNTHAETLLRITAEHGVITTTEAFRKTGTHPQTGTRDKKHLLALALIEEERITMRRGRGGTAVAMRPTRAGYERANTKPHGTRGGDSLQHEYLVRAIANKIHGAKIDITVGTKAIDILIAYHDHDGLARIIGTIPPQGALIAIEVEVSNPDKTAPRNSERNQAAGITHTIIATMTPLRRRHPPGVIVLDVFDLLEAL